MKAFMDKDFLLTTETARKLFFDYAEKCPIIDYHNHLPAKDIYQRRRYDNLTQVWLEADHYKWRCMRVCGVAEEYVTGGASDYAKFAASSAKSWDSWWKADSIREMKTPWLRWAKWWKISA